MNQSQQKEDPTLSESDLGDLVERTKVFLDKCDADYQSLGNSFVLNNYDGYLVIPKNLDVEIPSFELIQNLLGIHAHECGLTDLALFSTATNCRKMNLGGNALNDLSPLHELPLTSLRIDGNRHHDVKEWKKEIRSIKKAISSLKKFYYTITNNKKDHDVF